MGPFDRFLCCTRDCFPSFPEGLAHAVYPNGTQSSRCFKRRGKDWHKTNKDSFSLKATADDVLVHIDDHDRLRDHLVSNPEPNNLLSTLLEHGYLSNGPVVTVSAETLLGFQYEKDLKNLTTLTDMSVNEWMRAFAALGLPYSEVVFRIALKSMVQKRGTRKYEPYSRKVFDMGNPKTAAIVRNFGT